MQNTLVDVLSLTFENLLERRLQTLVWKRGLAKSPYMARQLISHGHITLNQRRVTIPSYIVSPAEEGSLSISESSSLYRMTQAPTTVEVAPTEEGPKAE